MASYTAPIALRVSARIRVEAIPAGAGPAGLGGLNADDPAYGQSQSPGAAPIAQTLYIQDAAQVPGTPGSITVANIKTAMDQVATDIAGSSGSPLVTAAILAQINGWFTGNG